MSNQLFKANYTTAYNFERNSLNIFFMMQLPTGSKLVNKMCCFHHPTFHSKLRINMSTIFYCIYKADCH